MSNDEHVGLKRRAEAAHLSLSAYCRLVLLEARVQVSDVHQQRPASPARTSLVAPASNPPGATAGESSVERLERRRREAIRTGR